MSNVEGVRPTVCLIGPATDTDFEDPKLVDLMRKQVSRYLPTGIFGLAAVLEQHGIVPRIVDLNDWHRDYLLSRPDLTEFDFCNYVARAFEPLAYDIYGFSTICGSYPLTVRIAEQVKRLHPKSTIIFGGPQATVVDGPTLNAFPFVDYIVRGEAEETFPALLDQLARGAQPDGLLGVTFRKDGKVARNANAPVIDDLDALPIPAFHLADHIKGYRLSLELGRGCPFACAFCSTNDFFRRNFRLKTPDRMLTDMRRLRDTYNVQTFDLIHDMFTVDRKRVVKFCDAVLATREGFIWSCSARTDCIDDALIDLMHRAGCRGIFFGIETGSARMQKIVKKNIDLKEALDRIAHCDKRRIRVTASLITGFPDETMADVRDTAGFFLDCLRLDYVQPQLHLLSALAGTPIETEYRDRLVFDEIVSDMSYQGWQQDPADKALIRQHRDIFSNFYGVPAPALDRLYLKELRDFLLNGMERSRWLLVALHQSGGHIVDVFDAFRRWRSERAGAPLDREQSTRYFADIGFLKDLLEFATSHYPADTTPGASALATILEYEFALLADEPAAAGAEASSPAEAATPLDAVPRLAPDVRIAHLRSDYKSAIQALRRRGQRRGAAARPSWVVARRGGEGRFEIIQLSRHSAELLRLCDGKRSLRDIAAEYALNDAGEDVPPEAACLFGLQLLEQQGFVQLAAPGVH